MIRFIAAILLGMTLIGRLVPAIAETETSPEPTNGQSSGSASSSPLPLSRSAEGFASERGTTARRDPGLLEFPEPPDESPGPEKAGPEPARKIALLCCEFRIFDARVQLYDDRDGDGYFTYFRVSFDVDTDYSEAHVYARLFLRGADGVWKFLYETAIFPISGSSGSDEYEVETELVSGYPTGAYDVLIKVYDAGYGDLVAQYGPYDSSALSVTPLEDLSYDGLPPPSVSISYGSGGGAVSVWLLGFLAVAAWAGRRVRKTGPDQSPISVQSRPS
jgi:hypothetical protein